MSVSKLLLLPLLLFLCFCGRAQAPAQKLKIFLDCNGVYCDETFIRTEINAVDFLAERLAADVHVLITAAQTGGGTSHYQLIFYGQREWKDYRDTLQFNTAINATGAEIRVQLLQYLKLGLIPLLSRTSYAEQLDLRLKLDTAQSAGKPTVDKWNYVVFNVSAEGSLSADQNYTNLRGSGSFTVNRTTDKKRLQGGVYGSRYVYTYKVSDPNGTQTYEVNNYDYGITHFLVASIGTHWGLGYAARYTANTFQNTRGRFYLVPVVEYNIFPYSDINNRSFTIRYGADLTHYRYIDTTLYNRKSETLIGQELSASVNFNQKWGSFSSGVYYRQFFSSERLYSTGIDLQFNYRVVGGLFVYFYGVGNIVHDQVYLPKGKATEQEVLLRRRQLASSFDYYTAIGINYRFGSKLNNFVNPRVSGYRGF